MATSTIKRMNHAVQTMRQSFTTSSSVSAGEMVQNFTFTFDTPFTAQPIIAVSVGTGQLSPVAQYCSASWSNVSTDSVNVRIRAVGGTIPSGTTIYVDVVAYERIPSV